MFDEVKLGDVAERVAGVGTVLTSAYAYRLFGSELADRRRARARLVSAWLHDFNPRTGDYLVRLRNTSDEPVYRCGQWDDDVDERFDGCFGSGEEG